LPQVIGCEGVEKACREFFVENGLEFKTTELGSGFTSFEVRTERIYRFRGENRADLPVSG
jgi:hypothetical protein